MHMSKEMQKQTAIGPLVQIYFFSPQEDHDKRANLHTYVRITELLPCGRMQCSYLQEELPGATRRIPAPWCDEAFDLEIAALNAMRCVVGFV